MVRTFLALVSALYASSAVAQMPPVLPIPFMTVTDAESKLRSDPYAQINEQQGWLIISIPNGVNEGIWYFPPDTYPAYPAVGQRKLIVVDDKVFVASQIKCDAPKPACDQFLRFLQDMDKAMAKEGKKKP